MSKREKILIVFALVAILAFVYFNYFLTPLQEKTRELETALEENLYRAREMEAYQNKIEEMNTELEKIDAKSQEEMARIPSELDQSELMVEIDRVTKNNGRIESVIFEPVELRMYYQAVPIILEVYCTYQQMHSMISELEKSEYLNLIREIKVDTLTLSGEEVDLSDGRGRRLDMILTLDFLGLEVNEIVPGEFDFLGSGAYGNEELFGVYPAAAE